MLHGDISNRQSPILAFNIDELLFKPLNSKGVLNKLINIASSDRCKYLNRDFNNKFVETLNNIWNSTSYSIVLVTQHNYKQDLIEKLGDSNICFTDILVYDSLDELRTICQNRFTYYFDSDLSILSFLSCTNACHINNLKEKVGS